MKPSTCFAKLTDDKPLTCQCAAHRKLQEGATSTLVLLYDDIDPASRVDISAELIKAGFALAMQSAVKWNQSLQRESRLFEEVAVMAGRVSAVREVKGLR